MMHGAGYGCHLAIMYTGRLPRSMVVIMGGKHEVPRLKDSMKHAEAHPQPNTDISDDGFNTVDMWGADAPMPQSSTAEDGRTNWGKSTTGGIATPKDIKAGALDYEEIIAGALDYELFVKSECA